MQKVVSGTFTFDSSYPTGGEDISEIFDQFRSTPVILLIPRTAAVDVDKNVGVDYTAEKLEVYTAGTEATNESDQSALVVDFIAIGEM